MAVGWDTRAWGYHGDDGTIWARVEAGKTEEYGEGHTVGCGINFNNEQIFFTKQGELKGSRLSKPQKRVELTTTTSNALLRHPGKAIPVH
jgi:hypothetical protein